MCSNYPRLRIKGRRQEARPGWSLSSRAKLDGEERLGLASRAQLSGHSLPLEPPFTSMSRTRRDRFPPQIDVVLSDTHRGRALPLPKPLVCLSILKVGGTDNRLWV